MTVHEARQFITDYYYNNNPSADDFFLFEEAQLFLINTFHDPRDMHNLAFTYLEQRRFDLECKYLEMAAEYGYYPAIEELGYIWYYGQTGTVEYKKAFEYFSKGAESEDDIIKVGCEYKLADMYHNGFYVEKDEAKYIKIIEEIYDKITHPEKVKSVYGVDYMPFPDVAYRLAGIRAEQGKTEEALELLEKAKRRLAEDIRNNPSWWGNIEVMDDITTLANEISSEDKVRLDIYDLYWISKNVCRVAFLYNDRRFIIDITPGEEENVIGFDNKWYRNARDFFEKAEIDGKKIVFIYDEIYDMEVEYGRAD